MENFFIVSDFMESFTGDFILFVNNLESLPVGLQIKRVGDLITLYRGEILLVKIILINSK